MSHWHDTPEFERVREARVDALKSKDDDAASYVCRHVGLEYFMRSPRSGATWFLCRKCCTENVELALLCLDDPPADYRKEDATQ